MLECDELNIYEPMTFWMSNPRVAEEIKQRIKMWPLVSVEQRKTWAGNRVRYFPEGWLVFTNKMIRKLKVSQSEIEELYVKFLESKKEFQNTQSYESGFWYEWYAEKLLWLAAEADRKIRKGNGRK